MIIRDQKRNITTRIDYRPKLARNDTSNDSVIDIVEQLSFDL
jgi:hypothetical protein